MKKKEDVVHKYSNKGKGQLREAVIIEEKSHYLRYSENKKCFLVEPYIEEQSRRLIPPHLEECPYEPYEFNNAKSINDYYLPKAINLTIDEIYQKIKNAIKLFNDIDEHTLSLLTVNVIGSYFQDRLSTVHYLFIVGGNGTGKSALGDTFECLGYRVVNITNATEAFWYRVLGSVEYGQVTIVAEEIDRLDENSQIMNMLKTGYQPHAKVPRMNNENDKMDFYFPFCSKILIAEKSPREDKARGVLDRTFKINSYKGYPEFKIKEVRNPQGNKIRQKLLDELKELRKILLVFKLIHFKDPLIEINIGLDGRDEELCKPYLQLFYSLGASKETLNELEQTFEHFLSIKNKRKQITKEAILYPIVANAISTKGDRMDVAELWQEIINSIEGQLDEKNENMLHSADYGDFYRSTVIGMICDKFGGELDHKEKGNRIIFNKKIFERTGKQYDDNKGIRTEPVTDSSDSSDSSLEQSTFHDNFNQIEEIVKITSPQYESGDSGQSVSVGRAIEYPPDCYYCNQVFDGVGKQGYEKHVIQNHPGMLCYPGKADIELHSLIAKEMPWEM